jgi:signal peptide peptidase SppA
MLHLAVARRGSMLVVASAAPCMGFMIPGASIAGVGRGLHSGIHRPHTGMGPRMMAPRSPLHKDGARPLSGGPQQLGAMAAAVTAAIMALPNTASAAAESVAGLAQASVASSASDQMMMEVGVFLAKTVISWGVPAAVIGFILIKIVSSIKPPASDPLDEASSAGGGGPGALFGMMRGKPGEPTEMLKIERLNERLDSFSYSLEKMDKGRRGALLEKRRKDFERAYGIAVGHLTDKQLSLLVAGDTRFRQRDDQILSKIDEATRELRAMAARTPTPISDKQYSGANETETDDKPGMMDGFMGGRAQRAAEKKLAALLASRVSNEMSYISGVSALLGKNERQRLELLLKSRRSPAYHDGEQTVSLRPPMEMGSEKQRAEAKHVFVLNFPGDVTASQVAGLRQEVTALSRFANATRGDEVVLLLNTGGGTVTGYGLAAAQLMRIKALGLKLHICVEQVAASGGYMMACCADKITASPFAVIGSIGVISEVPNVYQRLDKEGIQFLTVTAGKYKRTLTPTKKPTDEDFAKTKADIEQVLVLFKDWVKTQRPQMDIDLVATGETWFGPDALERKLVDELITSDDVLLQKFDEGAEIVSIKYQEPKTSPVAQLLSAESSPADVLAAWAWQWLMSKAPQNAGS